MEDEIKTEVRIPATVQRLGDKKFVFGIAGVAVVIFVALGFFLLRGSTDPQAVAEKEAKELVARVSELIVLPDDEEPVIATVADPSQLQGTPFFANAKVGDRVLIYNNARKAILYDPDAHRILEVAPLNLESPAQ